MFDNPYPFKFTFSKDSKVDGPLLRSSCYTFRTEKEKYNIVVEEYIDSIYIIKFFPKRLSSHPKRFNLLTGENRVGRIVSTCIHVMILLLKKDKVASFGFIGSHTIDEKRNKIEDKALTKRFKIYQYAVFDLIGEKQFEHNQDINNSSYLLVNNNHPEAGALKVRANKMFEDLYPQLH